jgi:regulator of protease activity HflC (stomatin/prohibitin superfamily)
MFDKLIDFLMQFLEDILPFKVINDWEKGVLLRFGKYRKVVGPGIKYKTPFVDKIWHTPVITQTIHLQPQTLTTLDEKSIVLKAIIRYNVNDVQKFLLNVMHASDALVDTSQGVIRDTVEGYNWEDLYEVNDYLKDQIMNIVGDWGVMVERVTITDLAIVQTLRIMSDYQKVTHVIPNVSE